MISSDTLNRSLTVRVAFHRAIADGTSEIQLFQNLCDVCVEFGEYRLAWFGLVEHDQRKSVRPVAIAGYDDGYVEALHITWDESDHGRGPTGTAIRTATPYINWDWTRVTDVSLNPWREEALRRNYASSLALPLTLDGEVLGALTLYSSRTGDLGDGELLASLMTELSTAIKRLRLRDTHR